MTKAEDKATPQPCRECGETELHAEDCRFVDARTFYNRRLPVRDSERAAPQEWQPIERMKLC